MSTTDNLRKGFKDIENMSKEANKLEGDSMSQLQSLFEMVDNYKKTNPKETKAMEDFIGKRCAYRKQDLF